MLQAGQGMNILGFRAADDLSFKDHCKWSDSHTKKKEKEKKNHLTIKLYVIIFPCFNVQFLATAQ